jgi:hypothetical protein
MNRSKQARQNSHSSVFNAVKELLKSYKGAYICSLRAENYGKNKMSEKYANN